MLCIIDHDTNVRFFKHRSYDLTAAQDVEGYVTYVNADDITGINKNVFDDDEVLVSKEVFHSFKVSWPGSIITCGSDDDNDNNDDDVNDNNDDKPK